MFRLWLESSINHLYQSAVDAFPHTTMRQHVVHTINIGEIRLTPFLGMKTLLVRSAAFNEENGHHYNPIILFKRANFNPQNNAVQFLAADNEQPYQVQKLSLNGTHVLLRCECKDFFWRFNYYDWIDKSLWGPKRKPYEAKLRPGTANPMEMPGMCKHLMALAKGLREVKLID
jgi:hypothetical protein